MKNKRDFHLRHQLLLGGLAVLGLLICPFSPCSVLGGDMVKDSNGFYGITWGAPLDEVLGMIQVETGEHIQAYELKDGPPKVGGAAVESLRFVTFDGQFVRVVVRYHGRRSHDEILDYLQTEYGPIERLPGSMIRGLNQQFTWRGPQTEVNLTYDGAQERGAIFIESRTLAPRFNESLPE